MQNIQKVDGTEAWQRFDRIRKAKAAIEDIGFIVGADLYIIKDKEQYKELGYDTFRSFLADPEIDITPRTADRLIRNFKVFILSATVSYAEPENSLEMLTSKEPNYYNLLLRAGVAKLDMIAGIITEENRYAWINRAATLARSDLIIAIRGESTIIPSYWQSLLNQIRKLSDEVIQSNGCPYWLKDALIELWQKIDNHPAREQV